MGIPNLDECEVFLPIRSLFKPRRRAIADLDPAHCLVRTKPCIIHIAEILALGDGTGS
jgi:hypothetical protein